MLDLGTLGIKISLDDAELKNLPSQLRGAENRFESLGTTGAKVGKMLKRAVAGIGIAKLGKDMIDAYADFQQLEGGISKLFGDNANIVMENAQKAFETAGLSANEYMDTVASFSASILKNVSGDTKKAAELSDLALRDMADNANMFGTAMEEVQRTYQSLARGNYAMLDNLKLGYAGTKAGLQELIDDANRYNRQQGINTNYQLDNYADIIEAIHTVQVQQKIAGTTEAEAAKTISGSLAMVKASWQNLLAGFANPEADINGLVDQLVSSLETFADNIVPAIVEALPKIIEAIGIIIDAFARELQKPENKEKLAEAISKILTESVKIAFKEFPGLGAAAVGAFALKLLPGGLLKAGFKKALGGGLKSAAGEASAEATTAGTTLGNSLFSGFSTATVGLGAALAAGVAALEVAAGNAIVKLEELFGTTEKFKAMEDSTVGTTNQFRDGLGLLGNTATTAGKKTTKSLQDIRKDAEKAKSKIDDTRNSINNLRDKTVKIKAEDEASGPINRIKNLLSNLRDKTINVKYTSEGSFFNGDATGHRIGLNEVPYDGYRALLHKGETVLTAAESNQYKKQVEAANSSRSSMVVNFNGNYNFRNKGDIDYFMNQSQKMINRRLAL